VDPANNQSWTKNQTESNRLLPNHRIAVIRKATADVPENVTLAWLDVR